MPTPRASPPTVDAKMEALKKNLLNASEFGKMKEGAKAACQEAASAARRAERPRKGLASNWPVQPRTRKATTAHVEKVSGSDPGAPHQVTLVRSETKPESEKKNAATPSTPTMKEGLPLTSVQTHEESMSFTLEEADLEEKGLGVSTIYEAPGDARTEGQRKELDLDLELRRGVENDAAHGEQEDADSNAAQNNSAHVDQLEGDVSQSPDSENATNVATADGASWNFGCDPECWGWQYDWGWGWRYYDEVPNSLPTPSGTSAATTHTRDDVAFDSLPIEHGVRMYPLRQEQIRYLYKEDGTWKLNSKISPIPNIPAEWKFKGYFWGHDKGQAFAYFTHIDAAGPGTRRSRPRGGTNQWWYREHYGTQRHYRAGGWSTSWPS